MKSIIHLFLKELEPKKLELFFLSLEETTVKIHELKLGDGNHLFQIIHSSLNTLFDFSKSRDYQILHFDNDKKYIGTSYAINRADGNFLVQIQSKWLMLIPFETSLKIGLINKIEKFNLKYDMNESGKDEMLKELNKTFPLTRHTGVGMLCTTVRRMKAEKELNIPISWRIGSAISVETGKRGNEMNELEWNKFYTDLCENLKRDYPSMYDRLFSAK
jgi:CRISPR/Cas system endoribonuclease Cas6 (RAMP superfamily)